MKFTLVFLVALLGATVCPYAHATGLSAANSLEQWNQIKWGKYTPSNIPAAGMVMVSENPYAKNHD
jgi:Mn2+/Fe2+ NRAMP family transporter